MPECCLNTNPDITGIGVRLALYIQIMLGWIVSAKWPDTFARNARTAYMTAIALIIASFIQLRTQELSLLDGIVVSLITTMMITFSISSSPTHQKSNQTAASNNGVDPNASFSRFLTQIAFVGFWGGWCANMWRDPLHFGFSDPSCEVNNQTTIVIFGREVHATDERVRAAALVLVSIGIVLAFGSLFISLEGLLSPFIRFMRKRNASTSGRAANGEPEPEEDSVLKLIRQSLQILSFGTLVYLIIVTELTIKNNDKAHKSGDWSYGQTIALVLLLQQLMDICSTWTETREEKNEKKAMQLRSLSVSGVPSNQFTTNSNLGTGVGAQASATTPTGTAPTTTTT